MNNMEGRSIVDGVWRALVRNSIRRGNGLVDIHFAVAFAWDVSKAFDRVDREIIVDYLRQN